MRVPVRFFSLFSPNACKALIEPHHSQGNHNKKRPACSAALSIAPGLRLLRHGGQQESHDQFECLVTKWWWRWRRIHGNTSIAAAALRLEQNNSGHMVRLTGGSEVPLSCNYWSDFKAQLVQ
jgi:hypothetical protein